MRLTLTLLISSALISPTFAQTVRPDPNNPVSPGITQPDVNPGEPVTGAGDTPTVETVPEGATRPPVDQLPPGGRIVDPNQVTAQPEARRPSDLPIIGTRRLLDSLADLDRPLSTEEITAYGAFVQRELPLRPELIIDLNRRRNAVARAQAQPPTGRFATPVTDAVRVSLSASGNPVELFTNQGVVSAISFFDRTGAAWPVASYVIGDEAAFQVYPMQEGSNQLAVSPLTPYAYSNLVVSLVGTSQPISVDIDTSDEIVHYRRDVTINAIGPNAEIAPVVSKTPEAPLRSSDGLMMALVQGAPIPPDARELVTDDPDVEAYRIGDFLYVRTNQVLISPSYDAAISGPGGINAYRLRPAPVVLITRGGQVTRVRIS